ncbi:hypothetical protein T459_18472 [Capsicum annuum]|uniref:ABC-2 type transporter domain-containing protein n=1 Tax=Capsicum annuum TaxID=4072 RepID=A0A2G2ZEK2_CAPAN|nr:hypothetical protein T459_18472 [Capsicum annuum]
MLEKGDSKEGQKLLNEGETTLDSMTDIDPLFMQAIIGYHKARQEFAKFYKSALLNLAYTSVKSLSESFKMRLEMDKMALQLFLMKRGGQEIYVGPLGHHSYDLIKHFELMPGVVKINEGYNPATWMLKVTAPAQEMTLGCMACLWKQHWSYWHNPAYTAVRLRFTIFIALVFGTMFWDLGTKVSKSQDLFNVMESMYAVVLFLGVQNASSVQPVVDVERTVFYRERAARMYSAIPYAFGQVNTSSISGRDS